MTKIEKLRKEKGISVYKLAELTGLTPQFFYMLERGEMSTENMKIKNIRKVGEVLGVNYWELVD